MTITVIFRRDEKELNVESAVVLETMFVTMILIKIFKLHDSSALSDISGQSSHWMQSERGNTFGLWMLRHPAIEKLLRESSLGNIFFFADFERPDVFEYFKDYIEMLPIDETLFFDSINHDPLPFIKDDGFMTEGTFLDRESDRIIYKELAAKPKYYFGFSGEVADILIEGMSLSIGDHVKKRLQVIK